MKDVNFLRMYKRNNLKSTEYSPEKVRNTTVIRGDTLNKELQKIADAFFLYISIEEAKDNFINSTFDGNDYIGEINYNEDGNPYLAITDKTTNNVLVYTIEDGEFVIKKFDENDTQIPYTPTKEDSVVTLSILNNTLDNKVDISKEGSDYIGNISYQEDGTIDLKVTDKINLLKESIITQNPNEVRLRFFDDTGVLIKPPLADDYDFVLKYHLEDFTKGGVQKEQTYKFNGEYNGITTDWTFYKRIFNDLNNNHIILEIEAIRDDAINTGRDIKQWKFDGNNGNITMFIGSNYNGTDYTVFKPSEPIDDGDYINKLYLLNQLNLNNNSYYKEYKSSDDTTRVYLYSKDETKTEQILYRLSGDRVAETNPELTPNIDDIRTNYIIGVSGIKRVDYKYLETTPSVTDWVEKNLEFEPISNEIISYKILWGYVRRKLVFSKDIVDTGAGTSSVTLKEDWTNFTAIQIIYFDPNKNETCSSGVHYTGTSTPGSLQRGYCIDEFILTSFNQIDLRSGQANPFTITRVIGFGDFGI